MASAFRSVEIMCSIDAALDNALVQKISTVFLFRITDGPAGASRDWIVDCKNSPGQVKEKSGNSRQVDVTIIMKDADFVELAAGKMDDKTAFTEGKMTLVGNMMAAVRLQDLILAAQLKKKSRL
jgi:hypothetical protein